MANALGNFNPDFYALNSLRQLTQVGSTARRIYSAVPNDRGTMTRGQVTSYTRPRTFVAVDKEAGGTTEAQDVGSQDVSIRLEFQPEVRFTVTDQELTYSGDRLINEHINPAARALAKKINGHVLDLFTRVGPYAAVTAAPDNLGAYITMARRVMTDNMVPVEDSILQYAIDSGMEEAFLGANLWTSAEQTGPGANQTLFTGSLGVRYGFEVYPERNFPTDARSQLGAAISDTTAAVNGNHLANVDVISIDGATSGQAFVVGDRFTIDGDPTTYVVRAPATFSGATGGMLAIYPSLQQDAADNAEVTLWDRPAPFRDSGGYRVALAYHPEAFGIVYAELPTSNGMGVMETSVRDPDTGIAVQTRMWKDGPSGSYNVILTALIGVQVLNGQLACVVARGADVNA